MYNYLNTPPPPLLLFKYVQIGGVLFLKRPFSKKYLPFIEQVQQLQERNLKIPTVDFAAHNGLCRILGKFRNMGIS